MIKSRLRCGAADFQGYYLQYWRIQNFMMGADGRGEGSGEAPSARRKIKFLPNRWVLVYLVLFTFMQKLVRSMGAATPLPLNPPLYSTTIERQFSSEFTLTRSSVASQHDVCHKTVA